MSNKNKNKETITFTIALKRIKHGINLKQKHAALTLWNSWNIVEGNEISKQM